MMRKILEYDSFEQQVKTLTERITGEIFYALGWKRDGWAARLFAPLFRLPTRRFARIAAQFENDVVAHSPMAAASNALPRFAMQVTAQGMENIPRDGPVLIASNHPGGLDSIALVSSIPRADITALVSDIPFLNAMPGIRSHVIFVDFKTMGGMTALREAITHLQGDGSILLFAHGEVEPDPGFMQGASRSLEGWSPSIEVMLRKVPQTRLIIATVSNALLPRFFHHPIALLRRDPARRQKLGEVLQVIRQMLSPGKLQIRPRITFSKPILVSDLAGSPYLPGIIAKAKEQLTQHMLALEQVPS
jgi:hypothetical protein